ncbi:flagellar biosynthesis anti-sigma factor FlgM [Alkalihalobacillus sp. 1P02AB]|uniref:flagellar biosynthesis anti-sigma factor FlgM n=1 Tax=Alkalihalobacillus sp. 1P02AB TaxID=3132260 RepID=UPI0039A4E11B
MEINPYRRVGNHMYQKQAEKMEALPKKALKRDQLQISTEALKLQQTNPLVTERQVRVNELKKQVESGEYKVNPEKVAQAFYDYWNDKF